METNIKVSIILPVYNAGIHLKRCLDTLINQTLKEIEIIIIIDCPTDGSDLVVKEYAKNDNRIIIIENEYNMHIGNSRNRGLDIAKGRYIGFSDHDDYRELSMYEELYKKIDDNSSDLVTCSYTSLKNGKLASRAYPQMDPEVATQFILQSAIGIASKSDPMRKFNLSGQIWNKLFRYDIIKSMQIRFPDTNQSAYEDLTFLIKYISYIKKTEIIPSDLYYHIIGITNFGATYQYSSPKKILYFLEHMNSFLKKKNIFQENKCRFYNSVQFLIFRSILLNFSFKTGNIFYGLNSISIYGKNKIVTDSFKKHRYLIFTSPSMQNNILVKLFYYISKCYYSHY